MLRWVGLVARLVVGGVWLWAGLLKVTEPESSVTAVRGYQLLAPSVADVVGRVLPMTEVVLGACLILGLLTRFAGALSALLQLAFIIGIASVWARGHLDQLRLLRRRRAQPRRDQPVPVGDRP